MRTGHQATAAKTTRNYSRFKALDKQIAETMEWCRARGYVVTTEREAYDWFVRRQIEEHGYATPPQEMANISAEQVKNEFGFELFKRRWRRARFTLRQPGGKVISLRRFLPWGPEGWRDTTTAIATTAELTEAEALQIAIGATAAAEHLINQAKRCDTQRGEAAAWQSLAVQPQQLFLSAPDDAEEMEEDGDDAE